MAKITAKDGIVLIGGYNLSTYALQYEAVKEVDAVDVTGLSDGSHNFIAGQKIAMTTINMLWDSASGKVTDALKAPGEKNVTIMPEGYTLGAGALSMPYTQANFNPSGSPSTAIGVGNIKFSSYGDNYGLEYGQMLQHGSITATTTGTAVVDAAGEGSITSVCSGTLHIWTACATDTYAVKIQHSVDGSTSWSDLVTFTLTGAAINSERVAVESGTLRAYRRIVATRTGSAAESFGFSVFFAHA